MTLLKEHEVALAKAEQKKSKKREVKANDKTNWNREVDQIFDLEENSEKSVISDDFHQITEAKFVSTNFECIMKDSIIMPDPIINICNPEVKHQIENLSKALTSLLFEGYSSSFCSAFNPKVIAELRLL